MRIYSKIAGIALLAGISLLISACKNEEAKAENAEAKEMVGNADGKIAVVDLDRIMKEYQMSIDLQEEVQGKTGSIEQELKRKGDKIQRDMSSFQDKVNKGVLVQSVAEVQYREIQENQANFQQYAAQRQQEVQEMLMQTQSKIANSISAFIKDYNKEKGYAMILSTQGEDLAVPVITAAEELDITDDIIEGLNKQYSQDKSKAKGTEETADKVEKK